MRGAGRRTVLASIASTTALFVAGAAAVVAVTVSDGSGAAASSSGGSSGAASSAGGSVGQDAAAGRSTAQVVRTDLVRTETLDGDIGFGEARAVAAPGDGVVTAVAAEGATVSAGAALLAVDAEPLVLLTGAVPAYRELSEDTSDGLDIAQLEQALVDLGLGDGVSVDGDFDDATADAVESWEESLGRGDPDGVVQLGEVRFETGPVRIATVEAPVGARVGDGDAVLTVTGTGKQVDVDVPVARADDIVAGTAVAIELADGTTATGTVASVSSTTETDAATGDSTVPAVVAFDAAAGVDPAPCCTAGPVDVVIERSRDDGVLAVPVTALLALAEGGYAVEVVAPDGGTHLVGVDPGTFTDDLVAVTATTGDLAEGTAVVVAG